MIPVMCPCRFRAVRNGFESRLIAFLNHSSGAFAMEEPKNLYIQLYYKNKVKVK